MNENNRKLTVGILAHVDSGKTTLSEAMLYRAGAIRKLGRVDHRDAFLDADAQEKERGITIFSGQANFTVGDTDFVLLDTPGHVDFSAEMERTLGVLDYAVLVISGKDGIQGHTATLWRLLENYQIPAFIFINKMDLEGTDFKAVLSELQETFDSGCRQIEDYEELAMCDEGLLDEFLSAGTVSDKALAGAIKDRKVFPCFAGSALKLEGVDELMDGMIRLMLEPERGEETEVKVFKITRDKQGERLTHIKVLGGELKVKDTIYDEKVNQIRIYSGDKYINTDRVTAGDVCTVTGLNSTAVSDSSYIRPVMSYSLILPEGINRNDIYLKLKQLEEEDPQLHVTWNEMYGEIQLNVMGRVQIEVLEELLRTRFDIEGSFGLGRIAYMETIRKTITGSGHFEPLRHYAEVHLLMEPLPPGSGLEFESLVSEDVLAKNWQRLIMTHLMEKEHIGTLTGSPITDMKISILNGRAHDKHTEGGDFRESTYRAIRQGLRKSLNAGDVVLLEPWYEFELSIPQEMAGKAMNDIQKMHGSVSGPISRGGLCVIKGKAPVSEMNDYARDVASYTKGYGHLMCNLSGYEECHNQEQVAEEISYDADRDTANTADSIFCIKGAGRTIPWYEAEDRMFADTGYRPEVPEREYSEPVNAGKSKVGSTEDRELQQIFERTYKKEGTRKKWKPVIEAREIESRQTRMRKLNLSEENREECLLVDGYNIIFAWDELKELAKVNIDSAREALIEILCNYRGYRNCRVILVFDAYKVKGGSRHIEQQDNITVVYTQEAETADSYIERTTYELAGKGNRQEGTKVPKYKVRVATSDRLEQMIIMGNDAHKISAQDFKKEVDAVAAEIEEYMKKLSRKNAVENPNRLIIPRAESKKNQT